MDALTKARQLVASGRFLEALRAIGEPAGISKTANHVFRLTLLERVGQYELARALGDRLLRTKELNASETSACEYVLGLIDWDEGHTDRGIERLQRSVMLANRARDLERLCWSQLRLWGMLANRRDVDAAASLLADLRANSIKLGDRHFLTAVHVNVAEVEAKRGLLKTAQSHTRTALNLLSGDPNVWLEAWAENINLAMALMSSDLEAGFFHGQRALELAEESRVAVTLRACLANYGNLLYLAGRMEEAIAYFERAIAALPSNGDNGNGAIDTMASIRLAQGRLEEADELLNRIERSVQAPDDQILYVYRYALLTRLRFQMHQGSWDLAFTQASALLDIAKCAGDRLLCANSALAKAEAMLHRVSIQHSVNELSAIVPDIATLPSEFHGRYEGLLASAAALEGEQSAAHVHFGRANRILNCLRSAPSMLDLQRSWSAATGRPSLAAPLSAQQPVSAQQPEGVGPAKAILQAVAALMIHAERPEFLCLELLYLLLQADVVTYAVAIRSTSSTDREVIEQAGHSTGKKLQFIDVGQVGSRSFQIGYEPRTDVESVAGLNAVALLLSTVRELESARVDRQNKCTLWPNEDLQHEADGAVIGGQMRDVMSLGRRVARTNVSVLITGESGTGKEILARAIHGYSARAEKPFLPFNCTAVPREMLESQLFGHRRGAFTGADRDNPGLIRTAKDGTLFLDEIGELGLDLQPKLLRFLESGEICPLGEPSPFTVDVRIIAATNSNLEQLVHEGRFREDLFYRLNVIRLTIPPLRERRDEIPALVHHFVARAAQEFSKGRVRVAEETMEHLLLYQWPGNVRQLHNELRRMVALAEVDTVLTPAALSQPLQRAAAKPPARVNGSHELAVPLTDKLMPTLSHVEREMIRLALRSHQGRVEAAARALGISRKGLYLKRQRLGL